MFDLDPYTESEELEYYTPVDVRPWLMQSTAGDFAVVSWRCLCLRECTFNLQVVQRGSDVGGCLCHRVWKVDLETHQACRLYMSSYRSFEDQDLGIDHMPFIVDNSKSWRAWYLQRRRKLVLGPTFQAVITDAP